MDRGSGGCKRGLRTSKMSTEGWWMVQVMVRPVSTMFRTTRITTAAALASSPGRTHHQLATPQRLVITPFVPQDAGSSHRFPVCRYMSSNTRRIPTIIQRLLQAIRADPEAAAQGHSLAAAYRMRAT